MKTYLTKDNTKKILILVCKFYYYFGWIPLRYYVLASLYGKVRPSYQGAQVMMALDNLNKPTSEKVDKKEYKEFLKQKEITENYYNTLQELKKESNK